MNEKIERWDRWDTRLPNLKDQQRAIDLFHKFRCGNQVGFRAWTYSWREFQGDYGG